MTIYLASLWGTILMLTGTATLFTVWSRRDSYIRSIGVLLFLLSFLVVPSVYIETLGLHRPWQIAWDLPAGESRVLAAKLIQNKAIYLYLDTGRLTPWPLKLPWDNKLANEIQEQMDSASPNARGQFMMLFDPSLDMNAPQFHPLPQPQTPSPKPPREPAPHIEERDA